MTDFLIKHYWHTPAAGSMNALKAPKLTNSAGGLINLLDAVLVNGFGESAVSMAVHPTDVNKAVITETTHGYTLTARISISGCDNPNFNTEFEIIEVPNANTYIVDVTGIHSQPAGDPITTSTSILVKIPSLGWTKEFSATNKAVYRMKGGNRRYLWLDDTNTSSGITKVRGAWGATGPEFTDLVSPFPDSVQVAAGSDPRWHHYIHSGNIGAWGTTTDIGWTIIGTEKFFYLSIQHYYGQNNLANENSSRAVFVFGDVNPYNSYDTSATILSAGSNVNSANVSPASVCCFGRWLEGYDYRQSWAGTWWNVNKPTFMRMIAPMADAVRWVDNVGLGRGSSDVVAANDISPIAQPILLADDIANAIRAEMPGMAVSACYINNIYPQNSIINISGVRYMNMSTRYTNSGGTDGSFLAQIDGNMHTLKGTL